MPRASCALFLYSFNLLLHRRSVNLEHHLWIWEVVLYCDNSVAEHGVSSLNAPAIKAGRPRADPAGWDGFIRLSTDHPPYQHPTT